MRIAHVEWWPHGRRGDDRWTADEAEALRLASRSVQPASVRVYEVDLAMLTPEDLARLLNEWDIPLTVHRFRNPSEP